MPNKRKMCNEATNSSQNIYIPSLNAWYPIENVINSAYRKVLDFKENAEKILEKEKCESLCLPDFAKAILDSRSFNISLQNYCIVLKCYITLEKDKDLVKKKRNETQSYSNIVSSSNACDDNDDTNELQVGSPANSTSTAITTSGGAKKVNVEVIMKSNPFRIDENEKSTRMELLRTQSDSDLLRFTYYVKPEYESKRLRDNQSSNDLYNNNNGSNNKFIVFTNDFFTVHKNKLNNDMEISLNEIVQTPEEQVRTEALGEKLCVLLRDRPRHRALLTNECKLNQLPNASSLAINQEAKSVLTQQEDETYYTRELIQVYGQPIVPSFHKCFNYQLSNTHYGYRTLRRLLNCDILKKYVKITKEEIKSLDRVVEFVQLTNERCLAALRINITTFYDPIRFENGIVKDWLDIWYIDRLKELHKPNEMQLNNSPLSSSSSLSQWSQPVKTIESCFLNTTQCTNNETECDQTNHLWFCLKDYSCNRMEELLHKLNEYIQIKNNKSELILVHTAYPTFEYKEVLSEARRILALMLAKSVNNVTIDELITSKLVQVARPHVEQLLSKYLSIDTQTQKINGFTVLFEILMILKRELAKEKNDEMKYSHFLCNLERSNQDKLKLAILQLKCVPCLNKFTTNFTSINHANMSRLLKQMALIVSTELQQVAIDLIEKIEDDKPVKYIKLKEEFRQQTHSTPSSSSFSTKQHLTTPHKSNSFISLRHSSVLDTPQTPTTSKSTYQMSSLLTTPSIPKSSSISNIKPQQSQQQQQQQTPKVPPSLQLFNPHLQMANLRISNDKYDKLNNDSIQFKQLFKTSLDRH